MVKNPPAMRETWVQSLGLEDPLEEGMATHSSILAWRIPWTEEPGCFRVLAVKKSAAMNIGVQMAFYFYLAYSLGKLHSFILQVFSEDPTGHMKMDET